MRSWTEEYVDIIMNGKTYIMTESGRKSAEGLAEMLEDYAHRFPLLGVFFNRHPAETIKKTVEIVAELTGENQKLLLQLVCDFLQQYIEDQTRKPVAQICDEVLLLFPNKKKAFDAVIKMTLFVTEPEQRNINKHSQAYLESLQEIKNIITKEL